MVGVHCVLKWVSLRREMWFVCGLPHQGADEMCISWLFVCLVVRDSSWHRQGVSPFWFMWMLNERSWWDQGANMYCWCASSPDFPFLILGQTALKFAKYDTGESRPQGYWDIIITIVRNGIFPVSCIKHSHFKNTGDCQGERRSTSRPRASTWRYSPTRSCPATTLHVPINSEGAAWGLQSTFWHRCRQQPRRNIHQCSWKRQRRNRFSYHWSGGQLLARLSAPWASLGWCGAPFCCLDRVLFLEAPTCKCFRSCITT